MIFSYNWLQTYFKDPLPSPEELADTIALHSFEVERVEKIGEDTILDVKILPDRAHYALSHKGVADEISYILGRPAIGRYMPSVPADPPKDTRPIIKNEDEKFCRRYVARYAEFASMGRFTQPSLLNAIGQRSINPIVDATNFVMYDIGQPLHAFDADKIRGAISVRAARPGEKITLLDGREIALTAADRVIADDDGPLVVAGAKGGKRAEVTPETRRIIIEAANFEPTAVRLTSGRHDIRSDSSKRFENEITPELAMRGMDNVCALLKEMIPDISFGPIVDYYPVKAIQTVIDFDSSYIEERLGIAIPLDRTANILGMMGIKGMPESPEQINGTGKGASSYKLVIPHERLDLRIREDIVEEVGRIYGYEKIRGELPPAGGSDQTESSDMHLLSEKIRDVLMLSGFSEVSLYSLSSRGEIETAHPLARDKAFVRSNLTDGMTEALKKNAQNADLLGLESIRLFEIGQIFTKKGERTMLAMGVTTKGRGPKSADILRDALSILEKELSIRLMERPEVKKGLALREPCVEIDLATILGEMNVEALRRMPIRASRLPDKRYEKISPYPFIVRDIAMFVPESVSSDEAWKTVGQGIDEAGASNLIRRHSLFDTFRKDGKISYAFRLVFQSDEKTLTDKEANEIMEKIYAAAKKKGFDVR